MALLGCIKVWEGGVSGTNPIWTGPELYERIANAEKWFVQARATQTTGTNPGLDVKLQDSNDGINWRDKTTLITGASNNIPINTVTTLYGNDTGTANVGGCKMRVQIMLSGTTPGAFIELWLTMRSND